MFWNPPVVMFVLTNFYWLGTGPPHRAAHSRNNRRVTSSQDTQDRIRILWKICEWIMNYFWSLNYHLLTHNFYLCIWGQIVTTICKSSYHKWQPAKPIFNIECLNVLSLSLFDKLPLLIHWRIFKYKNFPIPTIHLAKIGCWSWDDLVLEERDSLGGQFGHIEGDSIRWYMDPWEINVIGCLWFLASCL